MCFFKKKGVFLKTQGMKMSVKRKIGLALCLLFLTLQLSAKVEEGLFFRSYEVVPDLRTSLDIPSSGELIPFKDSLSVSFDLRLELSRGRFGYVCRLFIDNNDPLDLLLSTPWGGPTFLGATGDHRYILTLRSGDAVLSGWQNIRIVVESKNGILRALVNGQEVYRSQTSLPRHNGAVSFGRGDAGRSPSTDVAPMIVKNLRIRADSHGPSFWPLEGETEFKSGKRLSAQISNPVWLQNYNREWRKVWTAEMPSVSYICQDTLRKRIWFVSEGKVLSYDIRSGKAFTGYPKHKMKLGLAVNDLVILPDGTLAYVDGDDVSRPIRYDASRGEWEADNPRVRSSQYLHHNTLYIPADSSYIYLFGYGHYRYQKSARLWHLGMEKAEELDLPGVFPRYLAAAGYKDGLVYVLGGKGNEVGIQELGTRVWSDFFSLNLADGTVSRLWKSPVMEKEVPAHDLLFAGDSLLTLTYDPEVFESALQLRRFSVRDGGSEELGSSIPYPFLDIESEARLMYDAEGENYIASISCKGADGIFRVSVYMLGSPVLEPAVIPKDQAFAWWWLLLAGVAVLAAALWLLLRKRREEPQPVWQPAARPENGPGVQLLGAFRVRDEKGQDITASIPPQAQRLFMILILHTAESGGISNARLKSLLWSDKSDESYNNNRGVTMKKIRTALEQVGPIDIVSENGQWKVTDANGLCDYLQAFSAMQHQLPLDQLLTLAEEGPLLPDLQEDYLDSFKADYANLVLGELEKHRDEALSPDTAIRLADAALLFDSLDEEAIRLKCGALIEQKKLGSAQNVFTRFTEEFGRIMGEPFGQDFKDFVKK